MEKGEIEAREFADFEDRFQWFLLPGLLCILAEALLGETRSRLLIRKIMVRG